MEDVWEGIKLPSLSDNNTTKGAKIQDFLARPFTTTTPSPHSPITVLSLNTRSEFHFDPLSHKDLQLAQPHHNSASKVETFCNQFQSRARMCNPLPSFGNKKILRPSTALGDIRNARLMKNRESAARCRARKQAYVFELKQKIKQLKEENTRLRKQLQLLRETAENQGKRRSLYRTYTAPF